MLVISQDQLPFSRIARELEGRDHENVPVSLIFVDAPPGDGPGLHTHAYHELFLVQEGTATFTAGDEERVVGAGEIVVVAPEVPHRFLNKVPVRRAVSDPGARRSSPGDVPGRQRPH